MLIALSTLLARARRAGTAAAIVAADTADLLEVAVREASRSSRLLVVSLPATAEGFVLQEVARAFAHHAETSVAIELRLPAGDVPSLEAISHAGPVAVRLAAGKDDSLGQLAKRCATLAGAGREHGISVTATLDGYVQPNKLAQFCRDAQVTAAHVASAVPGSRGSAHPSHIREMADAAGIPLAGDAAAANAFSPAEALACGLAAMEYSMAGVREAYIAGLRTGLRNRSVTDPRMAVRTAHLSAGQALAALLAA